MTQADTSTSRFQHNPSSAVLLENKIRVTVDGKDIQELIAAKALTDSTTLDRLLRGLSTNTEIHNNTRKLFTGSADFTASSVICVECAPAIAETLNEAYVRSGFHLDRLGTITDELRKAIPTDQDADSEPATWEATFDGASRGNPGPASVGATLAKDGQIVDTSSHRIGTTTNNVAEYAALGEAIRLAIDNDVPRVTIRGDSLLIINQVNGDWNTNEKLEKERQRILDYMSTFDGEIDLEHTDRDKNKKADQLANKAFD